jgi:hypothetical protein
VRVNLKEKVGKRSRGGMLWKGVEGCGKEKEVREVEEAKGVKEKAKKSKSAKGQDSGGED